MNEQAPQQGLNPSQDEESLRLRREHSDLAWRLQFANDIRRSGQQGIQETVDDVDTVDNPTEHLVLSETKAHLDKIVGDAQTEYDENIEESRQHVTDNLPSYITQATKEAVEQGVYINNLEAREMRANAFSKMWSDPEVQTFSFRRHGKYTRDPDSHMKGQIELRHLPELRLIASAWAENVPKDAKLTILASPSSMPAPIKDGEKKHNARARTTAMLYGQAIRNKFGRDFEFHANPDQVRKINSQETSNPDPIYKSATDQKDYIVERNIGDVLEFVDWGAGQSVVPFFKELSKTYGGLTTDFWHDYTKGKLPEGLEKVFLENGGQTSLEKTNQAVNLLLEQAQEGEADKKNVSLLISHEEVIGSITYQMAQYLRETGQRDADVEGLESVSFSYNQGFDMHVGDDGKALVKIGDVFVDINLKDFSGYLKQKTEEST